MVVSGLVWLRVADGGMVWLGSFAVVVTRW